MNGAINLAAFVNRFRDVRRSEYVSACVMRQCRSDVASAGGGGGGGAFAWIYSACVNIDFLSFIQPKC